MKVSDITVSYIDHMGTDLSVVNAARVSFEKESDWLVYHAIVGDEQVEVARVLKESDEKLIKYLAKHKHYSPFNHTFISLRVKAPLYVARQLVKHEYMPWNEVSRRYVDSEPEFYFPEYYRAKADSVKQGSSQESAPYNLERAHRITAECLAEYKHRLAAGVCPEQARDCLPLNQMTEWYWSGTLKAFHKMLDLRLEAHSQYESQIVAQKAIELIEPLFPKSLPALMENN